MLLSAVFGRTLSTRQTLTACHIQLPQAMQTEVLQLLAGA
jgi:hypothetical protein